MILKRLTIRKNLIKAGLTLILGTTCFQAPAQDWVELLNVDTWGTMNGACEPEEEPWVVHVKAVVPVKLDTAQILLLGGTYTEYFDVAEGVSKHYTPMAGYQYQWNSRHKTTIAALPRYNNNTYDKQTSWQIGGVGFHEFAFSENFKLKAGVYYRKEEFGHFVLPMLGAYWKPYKRVTLTAMLPRTAVIAYDINPLSRVTLNWQSNQYSMPTAVGSQTIRDMNFSARFEVGYPFFFVYFGLGYAIIKTTSELPEVYSSKLEGRTINVGMLLRWTTN